MKAETVSCASSGHLWGVAGRCVMCGEDQPASHETIPAPSVSDQALDLAVRALDQAQVLIDAMLKELNPGPLKLCRDCKWCRYPGRAESACIHDEAVKPRINVVTGEEGQSWLYCTSMRLGTGGPCGIEARLFEARET